MTAPKRIDYLDGWRVVAIALVLADHLGMNHTIGAFYEASPFGVISRYGETGVYIFFFISGYVVSLGALREVRETGGFSAKAFYLRRFFRIAPPLLLYLSACLALGLTGAISFPAADFVSAALNLCNTTLPGVSCGWYVGHTWSLAFEEQFYWLSPLALGALALGRPPRLAATLAALAFAALPFFFTVWWIGKIGCVIAYALFLAGYWAARGGAQALQGLARGRLPLLLGAALIVFLPRSVVALPGVDEAARGEWIAWYRLLYIAAIPALVLLSGVEGSRLRTLLSTRSLAYLGRASYSIYLWQQLVAGPAFNDVDVATQFALLGGVILLCLTLFPIELRLIGLGRTLSARLQRPDGDEIAPSALAMDPAL
jgi:peptidoglycan/LPS O-acetylase OafA/YrhL